jgi:hypothetical protein
VREKGDGNIYDMETKKNNSSMVCSSIASTSGRTARFPRIWPESPAETGKAEPRYGTLPHVSNASLVTHASPHGVLDSER